MARTHWTRSDTFPTLQLFDLYQRRIESMVILEIELIEGHLVLEYDVVAKRLDVHGSSARCKGAELMLGTDVSGRMDPFNPAELFLGAIAACMIKGIEQVAPMIHFQFRGVEMRLRDVRQDSPPFMALITYDLIVDTDEDD